MSKNLCLVSKENKLFHHARLDLYLNSGTKITFEISSGGLNIEIDYSVNGFNESCLDQTFKLGDINNAVHLVALDKYRLFKNNCQDFVKRVIDIVTKKS